LLLDKMSIDYESNVKKLNVIKERIYDSFGK